MKSMGIRNSDFGSVTDQLMIRCSAFVRYRTVALHNA